MSYDLGNADPNAQRPVGDLIPDKTLAWAVVTVRPIAPERGAILTQSRSSENRYLDLELTICEGPYNRRKVWDRPIIEGDEKATTRGIAALRHIVEVGRQMQQFPAPPGAYALNPQTGRSDEVDLMALNGLMCAIQIGIDKGKDGYEDKNRVSCYLSPNPASDTNKLFLKLVAGDTAPPAAAAKPTPQAAWGGQAAPQAAKPAMPAGSAAGGGRAQQRQQPQQTQQPQQGRPTWAGAAPNPQ